MSGDGDDDRWWLFWLEIGWPIVERERGRQSWPKKRDGWSCGVLDVFYGGTREIEKGRSLIAGRYKRWVTVGKKKKGIKKRKGPLILILNEIIDNKL